MPRVGPQAGYALDRIRMQERPSPEIAPKLTGPKRQHFLPRFYLEGFARDGLVAVYDRKLNEVRMQQPVNTGVIGHFYTQVDEQGRQRFELEAFLSEVESNAKPVIEKLRGGHSLDNQERMDLAAFIALGSGRTPDMVETVQAMNGQLVKHLGKALFSDEEAVLETLMRDEDKVGRSRDELLEEARGLVQFIQSDAYEVNTDQQWALQMAVSTSAELAPILAERDWFVLHRDNPKKSFVTCDAPVVLTRAGRLVQGMYRGVGFATRDALIVFPLTQSCVLAMQDFGAGLRHATIGAAKVRDTNLLIASRCQRFVIGRDSKLVESLADEVRLGTSAWKPRMRIH